MDKEQLVDYLKKEVFDKYYPDRKVLVGLEFMDDGVSKAPQKKFVKQYLEKQERIQQKLDKGLPLDEADTITPEEKALFERLKHINGQSTLNGDGFFIKVLPPADKPDQPDQKWAFILDASVRPWHRVVEMVSPPLKAKDDVKFFSFMTASLKALEPEVPFKEKVKNFFKNIGTQIGYRISSEDKYNRSGFEASKLGPPGYQGPNMTTPGYGSIHLHHDATNESPATFLNEVNQYYNWQNFLHNYFNPGLSRINFAKPMKKEYVEELNERVVPMIKEDKPDEEVWSEIAKVFLKHFKRHEELKYQALNQVNKLMKPISDLNLPLEQLPETLRGKVGEKASKKITMEWRINSADLDPRKVLLLNQVFHNMALRAENIAEKGEVIPLNVRNFKPWAKKRIMNEFCQTMNLNYGDVKEMQKPAWDGKIWDDILSNNADDKLKPLGYPEVHLSSLKTTGLNIKNWFLERLRLLKEPEVVASAALGTATAAGIITATKEKETKNKEIS